MTKYFSMNSENKEKQIKINQDYFLKFAKFLRTTVECHDTKAKNPGTQLYGIQLRYANNSLLSPAILIESQN